MDKPAGKERRKEKRVPFKEKILVNNSMLFNSIDISEGGLYVYTGRSFEKNSLISVTLPVKGEKITVKARVQHNQPGIGMGLKFIELKDEEKARIRDLIESTIRKSASQTARKKILLVEDNDMTRQIYRSKLLMEGFSVVEAVNGVEAVKLLREQIPDVVILDLYMEKMDGFKVLSILRSTPQWEHLPVIVCSSRGTKDVMEKVINAGATEFLSKVVTSPAKLAETVKAVIQRYD